MYFVIGQCSWWRLHIFVGCCMVNQIKSNHQLYSVGLYSQLTSTRTCREIVYVATDRVWSQAAQNVTSIWNFQTLLYHLGICDLRHKHVCLLCSELFDSLFQDTVVAAVYIVIQEKVFVITSSNIDRFWECFTGTLSSNLAIRRLLKGPPHLKTRREMLVSAFE